MTKRQNSAGGFTLLEMVIASSILVGALALAMTGFLYLWSGVQQDMKQDELDIDVQLAMERVRRSLRLTSLDEMFFYPSSQIQFTGMSFPMARDDDGDGAVDLDADGKIIWDRTLIYHVYAGSPSQLRITTFDPRDETLTDAERQEQIDSVIAQGNGTSTHNAANASTKVVFQNLFAWTIDPLSAQFDGYAPGQERATDVVLGSIVLSNGNHELEFTLKDKNAASTGYKVGIDELFMSPSYSPREGEAQYPPTSQSGASAAQAYMSGGSWSGNYQLYFPATAVGHKFMLTLANDRWESTNFGDTGETHEDTYVFFDRDFSPFDFVVALDGLTTNWFASTQTGNTNIASTAANQLQASAVRVLLKGDEMPLGGYIETSGRYCKVQFRSGSGPLQIRNAYIAEALYADLNAVDAVASTVTKLTFGGSDQTLISAGTSQWSDPTNFEIDKDKSYLVSYLVGNMAGNGTAARWSETTVPGEISTWTIAGSNAPTAADAAAGIWSTRGDVESHDRIYGVESLFSTYPTNGVYVSGIFDTAADAPNYSAIAWSEDTPFGTDIKLKVRTGGSNDLSDAASWDSITAMTFPGTINPGDERYVQFRAELTPNSTTLRAPKLKDVTITWEGVEQAVDIGGTFTKGPDYGMFELKIDGQPLKKGIVVDLEIYDYVRAHGASNRITSALTTEVIPRNTGR